MSERMKSAPPDDLAMALAVEGPHGPVIHATNRAARINGVCIGGRVVDMRALCPHLRVEYADIIGDRTALDRLVLWARRWCPWTVADGIDGLVLETTGSEHLLGGETAMLIEMETRLSLLGLTSQLAVAPTWGAAWALARHGGARQVCPPDRIAAALAPLPVAALRLDTETSLLLHRLGLKTIGAVAQVPRLSMIRRFSRTGIAGNPLLRLDQAMGHLAEPVSSQAALPVFRVENRLPDPIEDPAPYLPGLCSDLCSLLAKESFGCRHLCLTVFRSDGEVSTVTATTSASSRDPDHLRRLIDGKLDRIDPGFGFDLITLEANAVEKLETVQTRLDGGADEALHLSCLIDRLTARFGQGSVKRPVLRESHVPERAEDRPRYPNEAIPRTAAQRPLRLLDRPEEVRVLYSVPEGPPVQFIWRRQMHRVARYAGPERIAPEWWHDRPDTRLRDYFRIEDQAGQRLWLYREGVYGDGRGGDPRWFVHGMFA